MKTTNLPMGAAELRARAEASFRAKTDPDMETVEADFPNATKLLLEELRVHQIQLEMQNEEMRRTQLELDESRSRYFDLYDLAPVGYFTLSAAGVIQQSNLTAAQLLGYTRTDLDQRPFSRFIYPQFADRFHRMRKNLRATGQPQSIEIQLSRKDGTSFWAQVDATATQEDGTPVIRVVLSDVTARKQAELEHQRLAQQEQATQKLESLTVMAGGVAHDFNNLLTAIIGSSAMARRALPTDSSAADQLDSIEEASRRASELCHHLLVYSGRADFERQRINLNELIESTIQTISVLISPHAELRLNLAKDLPAIQGDATQLQQVVMNLLINASEALVDGRGVVVVKSGLTHLGKTQAADPLAAPELSEGDYAFLEISDNGCGMDSSVLARVFDPFFTTKSTGRGLGMAAVQGIVRPHQGALKVKSEPGKGTTFRLLLPAVSGAVAPPEASRPPIATGRPVSGSAADRPGKISGTVLVADDVAVIRMYAKDILEDCGLDCVLAADGQEALDIFRVDPTRFKLVVLDVKMPRLGGIEAFRAMQRLRPDVQVVLMSGYGLQDAREALSAEGFIGFLPKPFVEAEFVALVNQVLG